MNRRSRIMMTIENLHYQDSRSHGPRLWSAFLRKVTSPFTHYPLPFTLFRAAFCLLLTAYCLLPTALHAQGCAMCYTSASAARAGAKEALANGVLILLVPPMVFFALFTVVVYIYRNKYRDSSFVTSHWSFDPDSVDREVHSLRGETSTGLGFDFEAHNPLLGTNDNGPRTTDRLP